ncbi:MAG TPA: zinc-ribbon domain-containing protein [Thermomicrobiaceae bacterium]|nr:zinc-ribbon domain-containing protein [Thermomicrobiaceae bacterium]
MYCSECGTENQSGAQTCEVCGSPLEAHVGARTCQVCGSSAGDHDRFCASCGTALSAEIPRYEPGPSFVDDLPLDVDPADLPPWLRDMVHNAPGEAPATVAAATAVEEGIPDWLRSPRPAPADSAEPGPAAEPAPSPAAPSVEPSFSFLTEDDLPEWLRALGDEIAEPELTADRPAQVATVPSPAQPSVAAARPPSVSRAWLARPRSVETASSTQAAEEFAPLSPPLAAERATPRRSSAPSDLRHGTGELPAIELPSPASRRPQLRLLLLALLVVVVVALVLVLLVL